MEEKESIGYFRKRIGEEFEVSIGLALHKYGATILPHFKIQSKSNKWVVEVDLLVITPYRVMCIEAKNYSKSIKGNFDDERWIGRGQGYPFKSNNPVMQNMRHIRELRGLLYGLGFPYFNIDNYVVVPNYCVRQTNCKEVIHIRDLVELVKSDIALSQKIYNVPPLVDLFNRLRYK